ncbi:MAG: hypothetical protein WKG00_25160 [Polyangiaceae bacterium]
MTEPAAASPPFAGRVRGWWRGEPLSPLFHLCIGLLMPMALLAGSALRASTFTVESAFIGFRYADNLAAGQGLVFNAGERVEGYSNFLWTLLLGVLSALGADLEPASKIVGGLCACAALWVLWLLSRRLQPFGAFPSVATWLTASSFAFGGYAVFGTEAPLLALLTLAGAERFAREVDAEIAGEARLLPWSGVLLGLACLTRMEAVVLFAALVSASGRRAVGRPGLLRLAAFFAPVAAHQIWRIAYYGALLPNTALATTGDARAQLRGGRDYLDNYQQHVGGVLWLALSAVAMAAMRLARALDPSHLGGAAPAPPSSRRALAASEDAWRASFALALCAWVIVYGTWLLLIGGDGMPFFRRIAPIEPFVFLLVDQVVRTLVARRDRVINVALILVGSWTCWYRANTFRDSHRNLVRTDKAFWEESAGRAAAWLRTAEPGPVAIADIGEVGYRTRLPIVDMLGVVTPAIARLPGGYTTKVGPGFTDAVFAGQPRYVVIISSERDCKSPSAPSSRALYNDARFAPFRLRESLRVRPGGAWCIYGR